MSFKNRVGNFLLLAGAIGLFVFAASAAAGTGSADMPALVVGLLLVLVGLRWRLAKGAPPAAPLMPPPAPRPAPKRPKAAKPPAAAPSAPIPTSPKKRGRRGL